ncbi:MAG TPA: hypothetical protein VF297_20350 [Pyrinomonadaceae bacterium]
MRKPDNLRISSYVSNFALPGELYACAVHGYSAAIDILGADLARSLDSNDLLSCTKDSDTRRLLEHRGYLTTKTREEEEEFVARIQRLFEAKQPYMVDFGLTLAPDGGGAADLLEEPWFLGNLFVAMNELRGISVGSPLEVDLRETRVPPADVLPALLSMAREWDFKVHLVISDTQLEEVSALIEEGQVTKLSAYVLHPRASWLLPPVGRAEPGNPFDYIPDLLDRQMLLEFLVNVEELSAPALGALVDGLRDIRSKIHSENEAQLVLIPIAPGDRKSARMLPIGVGLHPVRPEELPDYRQLETHMWSPRVVRFRPCFSPSDRRFSFYSSGEIYLVTEYGHGRKLVGRLNPDGHEVDSAAVEERGAARGLSELPAECVDCKLSLMCGGNCSVWNPAVGEHFREKIARLLTVPFINRL